MRHLSITWLQGIGHDVRFAARTAAKDRSLTAVAVGTLALSIGLNATLFTIVSGAQTPGNLVYLGSLNSWHGGSSAKDGGLHIMYDTLIVGTGCGVPSTNVATELSRDSRLQVAGSTQLFEVFREEGMLVVVARGAAGAAGEQVFGQLEFAGGAVHGGVHGEGSEVSS